MNFIEKKRNKKKVMKLLDDPQLGAELIKKLSTLNREESSTGKHFELKGEMDVNLKVEEIG